MKIKRKRVAEGTSLRPRQSGTSSTRTTYAYDFYRDGVTQTMLSLWLTCREQCRLQYVEGWRHLKPSMPLEYGSAMHWVLAEMYKRPELPPSPVEQRGLLARYHNVWMTDARKRTLEERALHKRVMELVEIVLPAYIKRASMRDKMYHDFGPKARVWVKLEQNFREPWAFDERELYHTYINGRYDGVFLHDDRLWLFETKNFSRIDHEALMETLPENFQVMQYLWSIKRGRAQGRFPNKKIGGVLYNILRRPSLRQGEKEPDKLFLARCAKHCQDLNHYFTRYQMKITEDEIDAWEKTTLRPVLADVRRWWDSLVDGTRTFHYMNPNALIGKYGRAATYNILVRQDYSEFEQRKTPFSELVDEVQVKKAA